MFIFLTCARQFQTALCPYCRNSNWKVCFRVSRYFVKIRPIWLNKQADTDFPARKAEDGVVGTTGWGYNGGLFGSERELATLTC